MSSSRPSALRGSFMSTPAARTVELTRELTRRKTATTTAIRPDDFMEHLLYGGGLSQSSTLPETPPAESPPSPPVSSVSCPLSAFRGVCVCARCRRHNIWRGRLCALL